MPIATHLVRLGHPQISNPANANALETDIHQAYTNLPNQPVMGSAQTVIDKAQGFESVIPAVGDRLTSVTANVKVPIRAVATSWDHFEHVTVPVGRPVDELIPWGHS